MAMVKPIALSITSFDANSASPQIFSFMVNGGNQVVKNKLTIRRQDNNSIVYQEVITSYNFEHSIIPNKIRGLQNDNYYNFYFNTYDVNDEESENSNVIQFNCYSEPTLKFTNLPYNHIINNNKYKFIVEYNQAESELVDGIKFYLYDNFDNVISESEMYGNIGTKMPLIFEHTFNGFNNDSTYKIEAVVKTISGMKKSTGKHIFSVRYYFPEMYSLLDLENDCVKGCVKIKSNVVIADGIVAPPYSPAKYYPWFHVDEEKQLEYIKWNKQYSIEDNSDMELQFDEDYLINNNLDQSLISEWTETLLDVHQTDNWVKWEKGFSIDENFTFTLFLKPSNIGKFAIIGTEENGFVFDLVREIPYGEEIPKDIVEVRGYENGELKVLQRSEPMTLLNNLSYYMLWFRKDNNRYEVKTNVFESGKNKINWERSYDAENLFQLSSQNTYFGQIMSLTTTFDFRQPNGEWSQEKFLDIHNLGYGSNSMPPIIEFIHPTFDELYEMVSTHNSAFWDDCYIIINANANITHQIQRLSYDASSGEFSGVGQTYPFQYRDNIGQLVSTIRFTIDGVKNQSWKISEKIETTPIEGNTRYVGSIDILIRQTLSDGTTIKKLEDYPHYSVDDDLNLDNIEISYRDLREMASSVRVMTSSAPIKPMEILLNDMNIKVKYGGMVFNITEIVCDSSGALRGSLEQDNYYCSIKMFIDEMIEPSITITYKMANLYSRLKMYPNTRYRWDVIDSRKYDVHLYGYDDNGNQQLDINSNGIFDSSNCSSYDVVVYSKTKKELLYEELDKMRLNLSYAQLLEYNDTLYPNIDIELGTNLLNPKNWEKDGDYVLNYCLVEKDKSYSLKLYNQTDKYFLVASLEYPTSANVLTIADANGNFIPTTEYTFIPTYDTILKVSLIRNDGLNATIEETESLEIQLQYGEVSTDFEQYYEIEHINSNIEFEFFTDISWNDEEYPIGEEFIPMDEDISNIFPLGNTFLTRGLYDHMDISSDILFEYNINKRDWGYDTIINCDFEENISGGNVDIPFNALKSIKVKRRKHGTFDWITFKNVEITSYEDLNILLEDYLLPSNYNVDYALVPIMENEVEGNYIINNIVTSYKVTLIADADNVFKLNSITYGGNIKNTVIGTYQPLKGLYPIIQRNSELEYYTGSITVNMLGYNYQIGQFTDREDISKQTDDFCNFLNNTKGKILKDWNGNIYLVRFMGSPSISYNGGYGNGFAQVTANWVEQGKFDNQKDLYYSGLVNSM